MTGDFAQKSYDELLFDAFFANFFNLNSISGILLISTHLCIDWSTGVAVILKEDMLLNQHCLQSNNATHMRLQQIRQVQYTSDRIQCKHSVFGNVWRHTCPNGWGQKFHHAVPNMHGNHRPNETAQHNTCCPHEGSAASSTSYGSQGRRHALLPETAASQHGVHNPRLETIQQACWAQSSTSSSFSL